MRPTRVTIPCGWAGDNHAIAFLVAYLGFLFNMGRTLANGPSIENMAPPVIASGIALLGFLLATQLLTKTTASSFISKHLAVNRLWLIQTWTAICSGAHFLRMQVTVSSQFLGLIWSALRKPNECCSDKRQACLGRYLLSPVLCASSVLI